MVLTDLLSYLHSRDAIASKNKVILLVHILTRHPFAKKKLKRDKLNNHYYASQIFCHK